MWTSREPVHQSLIDGSLHENRFSLLMVGSAAMAETKVLTAPSIIEYPFSRTTGPVIGAFMTALREGFVVGIRAADGRVLVPPFEYDPVTGESLTEVVEVASAGEVLTWSWEPEPHADHPLDHAFAWALVRLDGADTGLLHAVDVASPAHMATGMRVRIRWADERVGHINDIACFEPEES
jgi:uncharacterized OB-fold protein